MDGGAAAVFPCVESVGGSEGERVTEIKNKRMKINSINKHLIINTKNRMQEHRTEQRSCSWLTANHSLANAIFLAILQRHADIGGKVLGATISVTTTVIATARK